MEYSIKDIIWFISGTFGLSLIAFLVMFLVPGAQSPEGLPGLPVWFIAVWSPSIMAIVMALKSGHVKTLLGKVIQFKEIGPGLLLLLIPFGIIVGLILFSSQKAQWHKLPVAMIFALMGFNLILGPLGEELGWRGFLQPALQQRFGWITASLLVGIIWTLWHAPLWLIDSPQSEIPFLLFVVHVISYSLILGAAGKLVPDSLVPAVLLHLLFNVTAGVALFLELTDTAEWYAKSALPYAICAILVTIIVQLRFSAKAG